MQSCCYQTCFHTEKIGNSLKILKTKPPFFFLTGKVHWKAELLRVTDFKKPVCSLHDSFAGKTVFYSSHNGRNVGGDVIIRIVISLHCSYMSSRQGHR